MFNLLSNAIKFTQNYGRIWAESEAGKGSRFIFTIPTQQNIDRAGRKA